MFTVCNVQFNLVSRGNTKFPPFARKARALHPTYKNRITLDTRTRNSGACCAEASSAAICLRSHLHRIPRSFRAAARTLRACVTRAASITHCRIQRVSLCVVHNEVRCRSCILFFFFCDRRREAGFSSFALPRTSIRPLVKSLRPSGGERSSPKCIDTTNARTDTLHT